MVVTDIKPYGEAGADQQKKQQRLDVYKRQVLFCCVLLAVAFGVMFVKEDVPGIEEERKKG